jgi:hypothetical protein
MATMMRVKARWSGFQGSPGYSIFHYRFFNSAGWVPADATSAVARTREFFNSISGTLPPVVQVQVESDVEIIEETNAELTDVLTATAVNPVTGTASGTVGFAVPVGAVVSWKSTQIRNGRRMRGRTFVVPLSSAAFEPNGTLTSTALTNLNTAATTLRTPATNYQLGVFGRPSSSTATDGIWGPVTAHSVPDMAAVLRSRRD